VVPLAILVGGLWLTQEITGVGANKKASEKVVSRAN
jgi:hypothetical protein